jgi:hypothetical protein
MRRGPSPLAVCALLGAASVGAQQAPPRLVLPGDTLLDGGRLHAATVRYTLTAWQGAASLPLGRITDRQWRDSSATGVVVRRVLVVERGGVQVADSTATDARTLAPRRHVALQPTRRFALAFSGRRVKGTVAPEGFPGVPVDTLLPTPFFDAGSWDLVLRALPLAPGVRVQLPVYDLEGGVHPVELAVTGRATVQGEAAHVVVFTLAANRESTVWIGVASGRLLRMETLVGGVLLEQRLVAEPGEAPPPA